MLILLKICLHYTVVVTHTRKQIPAWLYVKNIEKSGSFTGMLTGFPLGFERSRAAPAANYSKVPKTCRQLNDKSGTSKRLTHPEVKLRVCTGWSKKDGNICFLCHEKTANGIWTILRIHVLCFLEICCHTIKYCE